MNIYIAFFSLKLVEVKDIFSLSSEFSIAHIITEDFNFSAGVTNYFKYEINVHSMKIYIENISFSRFSFDHFGVLMDQHLRPGDVGQIIHNEQYIFYLVLDRVYNSYNRKLKTNYLEIALYNLFDKMKLHKLNKLAIPMSEMNRYSKPELKELISKVFSGSNIEVSICTLLSVSYNFYFIIVLIVNLNYIDIKANKYRNIHCAKNTKVFKTIMGDGAAN